MVPGEECFEYNIFIDILSRFLTDFDQIKFIMSLNVYVLSNLTVSSLLYHTNIGGTSRNINTKVLF